MKVAYWFILLIIGMGISTQAQEVNKRITDTVHNEEILIGNCTKAGLMEGDYGVIFSEEYSTYIIDIQYTENIVQSDKDAEILVVLGTWCHDSEEQVPRFYRVLETAKFPEDQVSVICVDGNKTAGVLDISHLGIEKVPTFIFYRNGEEIGRIIETPVNSLEQDMWEIIK